MSEIFHNLNSKKIAELIQYSKEKLVFVSPGISRFITGEILKYKEKFTKENLIIIVDNSPEVIRMGYGEIESLEFLLKENLNIRKTYGIRVGFICSDDIAYLFTPIPSIAEDENIDSNYPNAILLDNNIRDEILKKIIPAQKTDLTKSEIGKETFKPEELEEVKKDLDKRPFIKPDLQRKINVISSAFQIVKTEFAGSRLKTHRFTLSAEEMGISDPKIAQRIKISYSLFEKEVLELKELESELNSIKKECLITIGDFGSALFYKEASKFEKKIEDFRNKVEKSKKENGELHEIIENILKKRKEELIDFISDNILKLTPKEIYSILNKSNYTAEDVKSYVRRKLNMKFPLPESFIKQIKLNVIYYNTSRQMIDDNDFKNLIEKKFNKSLDELIEIFQTVKIKQDNLF